MLRSPAHRLPSSRILLQVLWVAVSNKATGETSVSKTKYRANVFVGGRLSQLRLLRGLCEIRERACSFCCCEFESYNRSCVLSQWKWKEKKPKSSKSLGERNFPRHSVPNRQLRAFHNESNFAWAPRLRDESSGLGHLLPETLL